VLTVFALAQFAALLAGRDGVGANVLDGASPQPFPEPLLAAPAVPCPDRLDDGPVFGRDAAVTNPRFGDDPRIVDDQSVVLFITLLSGAYS
jgi:hypothetical protein